MENTNDNDDRQRNPLRTIIWSVAAFALLLPMIAMQFTSEVDWDFTDFVVFGLMLLFVCGCYELATRLTASRVRRLAVGIVLLAAFLLAWAHLAVGIV